MNVMKTKKYIVTIVCDETTQQIVLKTKMSKNELYDTLCKMYDEFNEIIIHECNLCFNFAYVLRYENKTLKSLYL